MEVRQTIILVVWFFASLLISLIFIPIKDGMSRGSVGGAIYSVGAALLLVSMSRVRVPENHIAEDFRRKMDQIGFPDFDEPPVPKAPSSIADEDATLPPQPQGQKTVKVRLRRYQVIEGEIPIANLRVIEQQDTEPTVISPQEPVPQKPKEQVTQ